MVDLQENNRGAQWLRPHQCPCGGHRRWQHAWSCKHGRIQRHHALEDVIARALTAAGIPVSKELPGLFPNDARRPNGITLLPCRDSNPGFPNPGIGDALIPGFRDYEKWTKYPNFIWYLPEKYRTGRYAVTGCKLKQNANEGCNSCASLAGLVLCSIACFVLLVIAPLLGDGVQVLNFRLCLRRTVCLWCAICLPTSSPVRSTSPRYSVIILCFVRFTPNIIFAVRVVVFSLSP